MQITKIRAKGRNEEEVFKKTEKKHKKTDKKGKRRMTGGMVEIARQSITLFASR